MNSHSTPVATATRSNIVLTHRGVEALSPGPKAYRICDLRCPGLAVRVGPTGAKTWDLAYRVRRTGVYRRLSLGPFPAVTLDAARERAAALTNAARAGRDLLGEEAAQKAAAEQRMTVHQLVELYLSKKVRGHLRTAAQMEQRLRRTLISLNDRFVDEIQRRDLRALLEATAERGAVREAQQQRQMVRVLFRWALSQDIVENDPSAGIASFGASPLRERVLSPEEISVFWGWLEKSEIGEGYADALRFQLATGARIGEVGGMVLSEIDQENWIWTLPPERSKNGRRRVTPIVGLAKDILKRRIQVSYQGILFVGDYGGPLTANRIASMMVKADIQI
jgi:site-specific recombinase XerD